MSLCRKSSRGLPPYTEDVVDVSSPEGGLDGLTLKKARLEGIHEEIRIRRGHLGAHGCALYLLVNVYVEGEDIAFKNYVKECKIVLDRGRRFLFSKERRHS